VLHRSLPLLLAGNAPRLQQNLAHGSYFGGRKPEDGCIDWSASAERIHNLVRGVAPPYPGAFTTIAGHSLRILKSLRQPGLQRHFAAPTLFVEGGSCFAQCGDGGSLRLLDIELDGRRLDAVAMQGTLGPAPIGLLSKTLSPT
jgi:methionyl-tRNA formyltransferase